VASSRQPDPIRPLGTDRAADPGARFAARSRPVPHAANDNRAPLARRLRPVLGVALVIALIVGLVWLSG
jgi:hypothetical protein